MGTASAQGRNRGTPKQGIANHESHTRDPSETRLVYSLAILAGSCFLWNTFASIASAAEPAAPEEFFEKKGRPVLAGTCLKCHNEQKVSGGLSVDSREALLRGGDSGPALVPGNPDASLSCLPQPPAKPQAAGGRGWEEGVVFEPLRTGSLRQSSSPEPRSLHCGTARPDVSRWC